MLAEVVVIKLTICFAVHFVVLLGMCVNDHLDIFDCMIMFYCSYCEIGSDKQSVRYNNSLFVDCRILCHLSKS